MPADFAWSAGVGVGASWIVERASMRAPEPEARAALCAGSSVAGVFTGGGAVCGWDGREATPASTRVAGVEPAGETGRDRLAAPAAAFWLVTINVRPLS